MIPKDPIMLLSWMNTQLRDHYASLDDLPFRKPGAQRHRVFPGLRGLRLRSRHQPVYLILFHKLRTKTTRGALDGTPLHMHGFCWVFFFISVPWTWLLRRK